MLGDVEETIYVIEEDDEEEESVKVALISHLVNTLAADELIDDQEAIRNVVRTGYDCMEARHLRKILNFVQETRSF